MLKLNLTTWQRLMLVQALNGLAGHISLVRKALRLLEILELNAGERQAVGLVDLPNGQMHWQDQERRFDVEIGDRELVAHLKRAASAYGNWPVGQGRQVVDLFEQLGIQDEPPPPPVE